MQVCDCVSVRACVCVCVCVCARAYIIHRQTDSYQRVRPYSLLRRTGESGTEVCWPVDSGDATFPKQLVLNLPWLANFVSPCGDAAFLSFFSFVCGLNQQWLQINKYTSRDIYMSKHITNR